MSPPSACRFCGHRLRWWENIPLISFIILGGKCRICKKNISLQYPVVELLGGLIAVSNFLWFGEINLQMVLYNILGFILIMIAFIDFRHYWIPDKAILTGMVFGLAGIPFMEGIPWERALMGGAIGAGSLYLFRALGFLLFRKESLGWGDIKLTAMIGIFLGWQKIVISIGLGFVLSLIFGIVIILLKRAPENRRIPLGTFLSIGAILSLWFGDAIFRWYWNFIMLR